MEFLERLVQILPQLRRQIQITGLVVLVAGYVAVRALQPSEVLGQIAAGSIGVLIIIFGTVVPVLRLIAKPWRPAVLLMMLTTFLLLMIALATIAVQVTVKAAEASQLQNSISSNIEAKFCQDAKIQAQRLVELDPKNPESHNLLGYALYCLKQYELASISFREAVSLAPSNRGYRSNYAAALIEFGCDNCYKEAEEIYSSLLSEEPNKESTIFNLALAQALRGKYDDSLLNARNVIGTRKSHASFLIGIDNFLKDGGLEISAIVDEFKLAERHHPDYICMLFGEEGPSNSYRVLITRSRKKPKFELLRGEMKRRLWARTC